MSETDWPWRSSRLLSERERLLAHIRRLEQENREVLRMWAKASDDAQALRNELAMCPEANVEMAAWQPERFLLWPLAAGVCCLILAGGSWAFWGWLS